MTFKRSNLIIVLILIVSAFLRFNSLTCGVPSKTGRLTAYHFDEYMNFGALSQMNPSKFDFYPKDAVLGWGSFQVYSLGVMLKSMQISGLFNPAGKEEMKKNLKEADKMYYAGRIFTGFFSLLSVLLIFFLARKNLGEDSAFWASAFFASFYVETYLGSIVKPDSIMLFWGILSFYFLREWIADKKEKSFYLSAIFAGLSFATKYTGIIFVLNFLISFILERGEFQKKIILKRVFIYFSVVAAVFLLINPYYLIETKKASAHFFAMFDKTRAHGSALKGYWEYFSEILPVSYGLPFLLFLIPSFFYSLKSKNRFIYYCVIFSLFYVLKFGYPNKQSFTYSLPLAPFFALIAGYYAAKGNKKIKLFAAAVLLYTFSYSFYQKSLWKDENTILLTSQWIEKNISEDKTICLSRIDIWTPTVLRKYDTSYKIKVYGDAKTNFAQGIKDMFLDLPSCDYAVLSEYEIRLIEKNKPLKEIKNFYENNFEKAYEIKRPSFPLFEIKDSHHYLFASFMNPGFEILKRGKNGSKHSFALLKRDKYLAVGPLETF
ncbi:MAG: phospholipid carrier-dependent glycosyltransferase [Elusimicrobia bacterium]|nr:phospholipid carrier-dependent glycosyltransferase [Elusimicrobiota bacterium]